MKEDNEAVWDERSSQIFIDYGRYFVPERELQIKTVCDLIPPGEGELRILELCCGEGLLADALLARFPRCTVRALDGSREMLERARERAARHEERFNADLFDLTSEDWRARERGFLAVVSSLAIHHLDDEGKQKLYRDVYEMLSAGGVFIVADIIRPADERGLEVAAAMWDEDVRRRARELDKDEGAFAHFEREHWNLFRHMDDPIDRPSRLFDQLKWLERAGFRAVDVYWMRSGHAIFGGRKADS